MNTIDLIIPTMWCDDNFVDKLKKYCTCKYINKIFIIDNLKKERPKSDIFNHEKITFVCYGKNIYVNPAWNEGYYRSKADIICLLNDDIYVEDEIFERVYNLDISEIDIIGSCLRPSIDGYSIISHSDKSERLIKLDVNKKLPIGMQYSAFGVCMFVKRSSYKVIPSLYKIWFGDDYLVQKFKNIYAFKTNKIIGEISKTTVDLKEKHPDIDKRIHLDAHNAYCYNHFLNVKNWKVVTNKLNHSQIWHT